MNQGRIWCVVHPTVGLPLLLGSVTTISLLIHGAVLTHTTWYASLYQGGSKTKAAANDTATSVAALQAKSPGFSITVKPVANKDGGAQTAFVVTVGMDPDRAGGKDASVTIGAVPPSAPPGHLAMAQTPAR